MFYMLVLFLCTSTSVDDCQPAHLPELFATKAECSAALTLAQGKGDEMGVHVLAFCADAKLPGTES